MAWGPYDPLFIMTPRYDPLLVVLSFVIAALASYAALDLASRVTAVGTTQAPDMLEPAALP